jgi:hypothetical protein
MATRIHNFSYSGSTGLLQFVPCTGDEKACKVYIKSIAATVGVTESEVTIYSYGGLSLSTKSADNQRSLPRATYNFITTDDRAPSVTLIGGCTSQVISNVIDNQTNPSFNFGSSPPIDMFSGVGYIVEGNTNGGKIKHIAWNVPEYFYMKPGDTLTFNGYSGTFHIELMAISES